VSARIRAGSRFRRFLYFVSGDVKCFRVPPGGTGTPGSKPLNYTVLKKTGNKEGRKERK
jgi:hypothetical protein